MAKIKTKTHSPTAKLQNENPFPVAVNHIASGKFRFAYFMLFNHEFGRNNFSANNIDTFQILF